MDITPRRNRLLFDSECLNSVSLYSSYEFAENERGRIRKPLPSHAIYLIACLGGRIVDCDHVIEGEIIEQNSTSSQYEGTLVRGLQ